jgi:hypothetical protein
MNYLVLLHWKATVIHNKIRYTSFGGKFNEYSIFICTDLIVSESVFAFVYHLCSCVTFPLSASIIFCPLTY